ncbi:GRASP55/65 PDZ-like domain-containing protein [Cladochytrium replicatum]|nr:GRASP55/65 PDZ-like domain-containing protein [Cladochytrium replicatum]
MILCYLGSQIYILPFSTISLTPHRQYRGNAQSGDASTRGYHVLKVVPNSPADTAGIEPYFDYVLSINNIRLDQDNANILKQNVHGSLGVPVSLYVYSSKSQSVREVVITPSDWLGRMERDGFVGCSVRFCDYYGASDHVWHILEVQPNSPAETAGLCPHVDYIIGTPHTTLKEKDDLYKLVEQSIGRPLQLFVYNTEWDSVREVLIVPSTGWGGPGCLGCDVGYGYLHRIPARPPPPGDGEPLGDPSSRALLAVSDARPSRVSNVQVPHVFSGAGMVGHAHGHDHGHGHGHDQDHSHGDDHNGHSHDDDHHGHSHDHREHMMGYHGVHDDPHDHDHGLGGHHHDFDYDHGHPHDREAYGFGNGRQPAYDFTKNGQSKIVELEHDHGHDDHGIQEHDHGHNGGHHGHSQDHGNGSHHRDHTPVSHSHDHGDSHHVHGDSHHGHDHGDAHHGHDHSVAPHQPSAPAIFSPVFSSASFLPSSTAENPPRRPSNANAFALPSIAPEIDTSDTPSSQPHHAPPPHTIGAPGGGMTAANPFRAARPHHTPRAALAYQAPIMEASTQEQKQGPPSRPESGLSWNAQGTSPQLGVAATPRDKALSPGPPSSGIVTSPLPADVLPSQSQLFGRSDGNSWF